MAIFKKSSQSQTPPHKKIPLIVCFKKCLSSDFLPLSEELHEAEADAFIIKNRNAKWVYGSGRQQCEAIHTYWKEMVNLVSHENVCT